MQGASKAKTERTRIASMLRAEGSKMAMVLADRLDACGSLRIPMVGPQGVRWHALGCKERLCPVCARRTANRRARDLGEQVGALLDAGSDVADVGMLTLTREVKDGETVRQGMEGIWAAFRRLRQDHRQDFARLYAGGVAAREVTLWSCRRCRKNLDKCACAAPSAWRRVHAHLHVVLVMRPGVPWRRHHALVTWWIASCAKDGRYAATAAQHGSRCVQGAIGASRYLAKGSAGYVCKGSEVRTAQDALDLANGLRGMRCIHTFGAMHGTGKGPAADLAREVRARLKQERSQTQALRVEDAADNVQEALAAASVIGQTAPTHVLVCTVPPRLQPRPDAPVPSHVIVAKVRAAAPEVSRLCWETTAAPQPAAPESAMLWNRTMRRHRETQPAERWIITEPELRAIAAVAGGLRVCGKWTARELLAALDAPPVQMPEPGERTCGPPPLPP